MKKNIVVCCQDMLRVLVFGRDHLIFDGRFTIDLAASGFPALRFCPWCGKELPFAYEEEN
ncbi:unnamed protein product [marine sediment metagenome]|uniref:Uncharacterized protein n=1 Tax=marine sediment metagenome TaxID=412755 RepID=X1CBH3_9ZZZZ